MSLSVSACMCVYACVLARASFYRRLSRAGCTLVDTASQPKRIDRDTESDSGAGEVGEMKDAMKMGRNGGEPKWAGTLAGSERSWIGLNEQRQWHQGDLQKAEAAKNTWGDIISATFLCNYCILWRFQCTNVPAISLYLVRQKWWNYYPPYKYHGTE